MLSRKHSQLYVNGQAEGAASLVLGLPDVFPAMIFLHHFIVTAAAIAEPDPVAE